MDEREIKLGETEALSSIHRKVLKRVAYTNVLAEPFISDIWIIQLNEAILIVKLYLYAIIRDSGTGPKRPITEFLKAVAQYAPLTRALTSHSQTFQPFLMLNILMMTVLPINVMQYSPARAAYKKHTQQNS